MRAVNSATINVARFLEKERAAEQNLAARATTCAFPLAALKQYVVLRRVNVRANEPPHFSSRLPGAEAQLLDENVRFADFGGK